MLALTTLRVFQSRLTGNFINSEFLAYRRQLPAWPVAHFSGVVTLPSKLI